MIKYRVSACYGLTEETGAAAETDARDENGKDAART